MKNFVIKLSVGSNGEPSGLIKWNKFLGVSKADIPNHQQYQKHISSVQMVDTTTY